MAGSVGALSVSLGLDAAQFIDGLSKADAQAKKLEASAAKMAAGIDRQVLALQRQTDKLSMSAREAKLYDLALQGATKAQLDFANAALRGAEAAAATDKFKSDFSKGVATATKAAAAAAGAAAIAFDLLVNKVADFNGLADKTGTTGEGLASFAIAAASSGVAMDSIANASIKLTKNLTGVDDESKAAGAALAAMGLNIADFKTLDPAAQLEAVSKALNGFADGPGKTAAAVALLGKAGAEMLPFFKDLEETGGRQVILTQQQIDLADEYAKKQDIATEKLKLYASAALTEALPAVTVFTDTLKDTIKQFVGVDEASKSLGGNSSIQSFAFDAAKALGFLIDAGDGVARTFQVVGKSIGGYAAVAAQMLHLDFAGAKAAAEAYREDVTKVLDAPMFSDKLSANIAKAQAAMAAPKVADATKPRLREIKVATGGSADDPTKKLLDNSLKSIEAGIKAQQDAFAAAGKANDRLFSQNLESIADYYDKKQNIANAALLAEVAGYDREIAAIEAAQKKASKATDVADLQGKKDGLLDKRALAEQKYAEATQARVDQQAKSFDDLAKAVGGVNIQVLEMQGHMAEAAAIKFDAQNKSLKDLFAANGSDDSLKQLDTLRQYTVAKAEFDQQAQESARVQADLQIAEDRISIAQQLGTQGELEGLQQLGAARQDAVVKLQAYVAAQEAAAAASGNQALIQNAEQARVALEKLGASAHPLADRLNNVFESNFGNAFADFITGSETAAQAFQSFAKSVISDLANIAAQRVAKEIFGGQNGGGIGGWLAGLFGAGGSASAAATVGSDVGGVTPYLYGLAHMSTGTDYVPMDNFPALLHKGEAVVPAAYNKTANRLGTSEPNWTIVNQTTGSIDKVTTMRVSAEDRALILQENRRAIAADHNDPNSQISAAMRRNYKAERRR